MASNQGVENESSLYGGFDKHFVLGAAVEETLQLDSFGEDVLRDALFCLLAEESRIVPSAGDNDDDVQADVDDAAQQALHIAKTKFISEVSYRRRSDEPLQSETIR